MNFRYMLIKHIAKIHKFSFKATVQWTTAPAGSILSLSGQKNTLLGLEKKALKRLSGLEGKDAKRLLNFSLTFPSEVK